MGRARTAPRAGARPRTAGADARTDGEVRQSGGGAATHLEQHAEASGSGRILQSGRGTAAGHERGEQRAKATGRSSPATTSTRARGPEESGEQHARVFGDGRGRAEQSGDDDHPGQGA
ncbi:hypothetical protein Shyd_05900 [Streptomyces hydrogenans]|uniref:Uncharacterized protein n=1 Tax=Streptomyces hydrogenans TaxID=1873719 RepID=A0ABQ3P2H9_9ACTN|nr:hypothetical protein [Streptomyces hydrogenans]GHI19219.1 hypothetical protein Shyd_05900 [Streptomyces hydrogenans]